MSMVGVAGRSTGCNTCRKRKIKCDGDRPHCGQCQKSKRICTGYQRDRHFKNLTELDRNSLLARAQPLAPITKPSIIVYNGSALASKLSELGDAANGDSYRLRVPSTYESCNHSNLFVDFMDNYIPNEHVNAKDPPVSWLQTIPAMQGKTASLDLAISALSMVRLGRNCRSDSLRRKGMANYGRAIGGLQSMLSNKSLLYDEQTLASCMTMSIYEVLEASGGNTDAWISHIGGISRLFQLRGPALHVAESSHRLFLGFRPTGIIYDSVTRKPSYLSEDTWMTIPWMIRPKSDFHELLDIMAQIPNCIGKTECLLRFSDRPALHTTISSKLSLLTQSWALISELQDWHRKLSKKYPEPAFCERKSSPMRSTSGPGLDPVFGISFNFKSFELARVHLFYWAALLLLYNNIQMISRSTSRPMLKEQNLASSSMQHTTSPPQNAANPGAAILSLPSSMPIQNPVANEFLVQRTSAVATQIAQSMEYLLSEDMHILGPQNVFFPLRIAMHAFSGGAAKPEENWCKDVFEELDRRGYPFGKILSGVEWDDIPSFLSRKCEP